MALPTWSRIAAEAKRHVSLKYNHLLIASFMLSGSLLLSLFATLLATVQTQDDFNPNAYAIVNALVGKGLTQNHQQQQHNSF